MKSTLLYSRYCRANGATLAMLKETGQFLESSPAVHFIPSALPGGHALAQASIPDDGTSKKVSLYCSVGSLQDVLMVTGYKLICTYYERVVDYCWYTPCSRKDLGASPTSAIF